MDVTDPEGDPLTVQWDVRVDVADNPGTGGDPERPTPPIAGAVLSSEGKEAVMKLPDQDGNYRIFVYVSDPLRSAATANVPIQVKSRGQP